MIRDFLAGNFLAHTVTFGDFMAGNFLAGDFLGWIRINVLPPYKKNVAYLVLFSMSRFQPAN